MLLLDGWKKEKKSLWLQHEQLPLLWPFPIQVSPSEELWSGLAESGSESRRKQGKSVLQVIMMGVKPQTGDTTRIVDNEIFAIEVRMWECTLVIHLLFCYFQKEF